MWTIIHARILLHQATNFGINIVIIRFSIRRHCGALENGFPFWMFPKGIRSENLSGVGLGRNSFFEIVTICSALGVLFLTWWRRWFFFFEETLLFSHRPGEHTDEANARVKKYCQHSGRTQTTDWWRWWWGKEQQQQHQQQTLLCGRGYKNDDNNNTMKWTSETEGRMVDPLNSWRVCERVGIGV